jgi:RNA polymerase sigma-70 factor (ECF subfamily)
MSEDRIEELLEKLCSGDDAAAEQVFRLYEPYLRTVVRRQLTPALRARFDSIDVVQSVWADILSGFREAGWRFLNAQQLRAFLVQATRNRFIDRVRELRPALEREQRLMDHIKHLASAEPRPSEETRASELWQQILDRCPPAHREILHLKREGKSLAQISEAVGLHPDSIRRVLRELARQVALDAPSRRQERSNASEQYP